MKKIKNETMATAVIIRLRDLHLYGLSRTNVWRMEQAGEFVPRVRLSQNTIGYRKEDLDTWIEARIEPTAEEGSNNG